MCILSALNIGKSFQQNRERLKVVDGFSLSIARGEFVALIGPSGCGKTTILKILAGLEKADTGSMKWTSEINVPHRISFAFQHLALLPWLDAVHNVAFPLIDTLDKETRHEKARGLIDEFGLSGFEGFYPAQLSGGMRQRVALARALVTEPSLLILDEPFGALDLCSRLRIQDLILEKCAERDVGAILVTHNLTEAVRLCQRVLVLTERPAQVLQEIPTNEWTVEERMELSVEDVASAAKLVEKALRSTDEASAALAHREGGDKS